MAKKRKTRQEKIIADLRRQLNTQETQAKEKTVSTGLYSLPQTKSFQQVTNKKPIANNYTYVISDLRKTVLFTIIALAAQIAIYFASQ